MSRVDWLVSDLGQVVEAAVNKGQKYIRID
jgi:hypothetical protein